MVIDSTVGCLCFHLSLKVNTDQYNKICNKIELFCYSTLLVCCKLSKIPHQNDRIQIQPSL